MLKGCYMLEIEGSVRPAIADLVPVERDKALGPVSWDSGYRIILDDDDVQHPEQNARWLTRINVPDVARGQGYGSKLLVTILADADADGVTLYLAPVPSGGLKLRALIRWYKRNGFKTDKLGIMRRDPSVLVEA